MKWSEIYKELRVGEDIWKYHNHRSCLHWGHKPLSPVPTVSLQVICERIVVLWESQDITSKLKASRDYTCLGSWMNSNVVGQGQCWLDVRMELWAGS